MSVSGLLTFLISFKNMNLLSSSIYKHQHGARPCVEKMQLIFFVPPNEELEGTLHPQKFGCTPKNEGKKVHVPPDEKTCGHERKLTAFSPRKVVHHAVFCKYYAELEKKNISCLTQCQTGNVGFCLTHGL
jgi:hypothetical protein